MLRESAGTGSSRYCQNCRNLSDNAAECNHCGIIFSRFEALRRQKQQERLNREAHQRQRRYRRKIATLFAVILPSSLAVMTILLTAALHHRVIIESVRDLPSRLIEKERSSPIYNPSDKSQVARARRCTVLIETPWGYGSGFFITPTQVVTNKHVVNYGYEDYLEYRQRIERERRDLDRQQENINRLKKGLKPGDGGQQQEILKIFIEQLEERYRQQKNDFIGKEIVFEDIRARIESPTLRIFLHDGREIEAGPVLLGHDFDLALIEILNTSHPYLAEAPAEHVLQQGDTVYAVGNPKGLRNSVTAGIFSGYRRSHEYDLGYLQTDAPINPGNSGGPLIDRFGKVIGINTMKYADAEGLGFAVPIEAVHQEFGYVLP